MDLFAAINPLLVVSGFVVGMLVGLTGVGGGSLMTPILFCCSGARDDRCRDRPPLRGEGTEDWRVTGRLAAGSIPATILTLFALHILGIKGNASPPLITTALGIALVMTAVRILSHRWLRLLTATRHAEPDPWWTATLTTFAGLLLGAFVTLSSVGAGAIGMTALVLLYPRTPIARLVGSDIAQSVPLTLIAGVGNWLHSPAFAGVAEPPSRAKGRPSAPSLSRCASAGSRRMHVKTAESQELRLLLTNRKTLLTSRVTLENEIRGTLKAIAIRRAAGAKEPAIDHVVDEDPGGGSARHIRSFPPEAERPGTEGL